MTTSPLLPELKSLIKEYATPSLRIRNNPLQIHCGDTHLECKIKSGLWYMRWAPPVIPSPDPSYIIRSLLLQHESVTLDKVEIHISDIFEFLGTDHYGIVEDTITFCSKEQPLLTINITEGNVDKKSPNIRALSSTIAVSNDSRILALFVQYYDQRKGNELEIPIKALISKRAVETIDRMGLGGDYTRSTLYDVTYDNLQELFTPQELKIMGYQGKLGKPGDVNDLTFAFENQVKIGGYIGSYFPQGFERAQTNDLYFYLTDTTHQAIRVNKEYREIYIKALIANIFGF